MNEEMAKRFEPAGTAFGVLSPPARHWEFLRRQSEGEPTLGQLIFDVTIGIILPLLCLVFDPLVFRGEFYSNPLLGSYQFFAYGLIGIEIVALVVWLALGKRAGEWCGVLGGMMVAGVLFSVCIGLLLLPFSLIGLMFIVGMLGFTPFVTAFIYWRNARRALHVAGARLTRAGVCLTVAFGALVPFSAPAFAHWRIDSMIERSLPEVTGDDERRAAEATRRLSYVSPFVRGNFDSLVQAYSAETDTVRRERLARAYRDITGGDIQTRLRVLND